jgi:hypothetical protein
MSVTAFEMKLKLVRKELGNVNLCNYSSCDCLLNDGSVRAHDVEIIDCLAENFKIRFTDFRSHVTCIPIFYNPFFDEVSGTLS